MGHICSKISKKHRLSPSTSFVSISADHSQSHRMPLMKYLKLSKGLSMIKEAQVSQEISKHFGSSEL